MLEIPASVIPTAAVARLTAADWRDRRVARIPASSFLCNLRCRTSNLSPLPNRNDTRVAPDKSEGHPGKYSRVRHPPECLRSGNIFTINFSFIPFSLARDSRTEVVMADKMTNTRQILYTYSISFAAKIASQYL
jgi:hypothetical protein